MIDIIPAHEAMLDFIDVQEKQREAFLRGLGELKLALRSGAAHALVNRSRLLAIGGVVPTWERRGTAWCVLASGIGADMPGVTRMAKRGLVLQSSKYDRIETHVEASHDEGHRWMRLLGFSFEGTMRKFFYGRDYALYAIVR